MKLWSGSDFSPHSSLLSRFPTVFRAESSGLVSFTEDLNSPDKRSIALAGVLLELRELELE